MGSELGKQFFVEVSMPLIEPKLALLEMQVESLFSDAVELPQTRFREAPKALNAVDVILAAGELIRAVICDRRKQGLKDPGTRPRPIIT